MGKKNIPKIAYQDGYESGFEDGYRDGYSVGFDNGWRRAKEETNPPERPQDRKSITEKSTAQLIGLVDNSPENSGLMIW